METASQLKSRNKDHHAKYQASPSGSKARLSRQASMSLSMKASICHKCVGKQGPCQQRLPPGGNVDNYRPTWTTLCASIIGASSTDHPPVCSGPRNHHRRLVASSLLSWHHRHGGGGSVGEFTWKLARCPRGYSICQTASDLYSTKLSSHYNFRYRPQYVLLRSSIEISQLIKPTLSGFFLVFKVTPTLPQGLFMDRKTGVISGIPQQVMGPTHYQIEATDGQKHWQTFITIEILAASGGKEHPSKQYISSHSGSCYVKRFSPTNTPTPAPTLSPTPSPTPLPTVSPTFSPTAAPSLAPTTAKPSQAPTRGPTHYPTTDPTTAPSDAPTEAPTSKPTRNPTDRPTRAPTLQPTAALTLPPTLTPTVAPSMPPTPLPTPTPTTPGIMNVCHMTVYIRCVQTSRSASSCLKCAHDLMDSFPVLPDECAMVQPHWRDQKLPILRGFCGILGT
jgi:hypothetical protein